VRLSSKGVLGTRGSAGKGCLTLMPNHLLPHLGGRRGWKRSTLSITNSASAEASCSPGAYLHHNHSARVITHRARRSYHQGPRELPPQRSRCLPEAHQHPGRESWHAQHTLRGRGAVGQRSAQPKGGVRGRGGGAVLTWSGESGRAPAGPASAPASAQLRSLPCAFAPVPALGPRGPRAHPRGDQPSRRPSRAGTRAPAPTRGAARTSPGALPARLLGPPPRPLTRPAPGYPNPSSRGRNPGAPEIPVPPPPLPPAPSPRLHCSPRRGLGCPTPPVPLP